MAGVNRTTEDSGGQAHGLRFLNDEWNNTIINGDEFTLRWNASLDLHNAELGLFRVMYPDQGVVVYQLDSNLTRKLIFHNPFHLFYIPVPCLLFFGSVGNTALHRDRRHWRSAAGGPQAKLTTRRRIYGASVMRLGTEIIGR